MRGLGEREGGGGGWSSVVASLAMRWGPSDVGVGWREIEEERGLQDSEYRKVSESNVE